MDNGDLTLEKAEQLNDMAYELYAEAFEGTSNINKLLKDCRTEYQNNIKDIKKAIKAGNIDIAKRNIQSAKKNIMEASKLVDKIPVNASDNVLGYLVETGNAFIKVTLADALLQAILKGKFMLSMIKDVDDSASIINSKAVRKHVANATSNGFSYGLKYNQKEKLAAAAIGAVLATVIRYSKDKDVNYYKAHAKKQFNLCLKQLDKLDKKLDKKAFKESCEYDESSSDDLFISNILDCYLEEVITDDEFISIMESYNDYM